MGLAEPTDTQLGDVGITYTSLMHEEDAEHQIEPCLTALVTSTLVQAKQDSQR